MIRRFFATLMLCCTATCAWCAKPSILILGYTKATGGAEVHILSLHQKLLENGYKSLVVVTKDSIFEEEIKATGLPYYAAEHQSHKSLIDLCKERQVDIIHCNKEQEIPVVQKIVEKYPAQVVYTRHDMARFRNQDAYNVDAIACVSTPIQDNVCKKITQRGLSTHVTHIPPLYLPERFETFRTTQTKKEFFEKHFSFTPRNCPMLCIIANFWPVKNQEVALRAFAKLIHKKNRSIELVLAGYGTRQKHLEQLVKHLKIDPYVHFLGFTDKVPGVLFHADINVLSSKREALGVSLLEASLMKTPSIVSSKTGMLDVIKHNQTGLVFRNRKYNSLARQIETLLDNPDLAHALAENAYHFVREEFDPQKSFEKYCEVYDHVLKKEEAKNHKTSPEGTAC